MASIHPTETPGKFRVRVYVGTDETGRKVQPMVTVTATTRTVRRVAAELEAKMRAEFDTRRAEVASLGGDTLADLWATMIDTRKGRWADNYLRLQTQARDAAIADGIGARPVRDIKPLEVQAHLNRYAATPTKPGNPRAASSVRQHLKYMRTVFQYGVDVEVLGRSPARAVDVPAALPAVTRDVPTLDDVASQLDAALATLATTGGRPSDASVWMPLVTRLVIATGCRSGEVVCVRYSDFAGRTLTLERHVVGRPERVVPGLKAKNKPVRRMTVDATTLAMVEATRARVSDELMAQGLGPVSDDAYVLSLDGGLTPLSQDLVQGWWRRVRAAMGRPAMRLHDLRHAMASDLLDAGMPPATIAERLGHSVSELLATYSHGRPASDEAMADYIESLISPAR